MDFLVERLKFDVDSMIRMCPAVLAEEARIRHAHEAKDAVPDDAIAAGGARILLDALG